VIELPESFVRWRIEVDGEAGSAWLDGLPALVEELCDGWGLRLDQATALHGRLGLVLMVHRGSEPCALKLCWAQDTAGEAAALRTWDGRGAARLLDANLESGVLLMERLDPHRSLHRLEIRDAAAVAGVLIRRLAVPAPRGVSTLREISDGIARSLPGRQRELGSPVPARWLDAAVGLAAELGARPGGLLVHADLHYGNVLAGRREPWLAVDPRPVNGDPEYSVPELMWTRADELGGEADVRRLLAVIVEAGELDADAALGWTVARSVDYWLWCRFHGLTIDPGRCARLLEALT
jgi:streptomycin 6-kinase